MAVIRSVNQQFATSGASALATGDVTVWENSTGTDAKMVSATGLAEFAGNFGTFINVRTYGATGNGTTNDTPQIQAAIDAFVTQMGLGQLPAGTANPNAILYFPPGQYLLEGGLDFTDIQSARWNVMGYGAQLDCQMTGKVAIDLSGSKGSQWHGINLVGHATNTPSMAFLQIRPQDVSARQLHGFHNVTILGEWEKTCYFNSGIELVRFVDCEFNNTVTSTGACAVLIDPENTSSATSEFTTVATSGVSHNANIFYGCYFRRVTGEGPAIRIEGTASAPAGGEAREINFHDCYAVANATAGGAIEINAPTHRFCWDGHVEGSPSIAHAVLFGNTVDMTHHGFSFVEHYSAATDSVFEATATNRVILNGASIGANVAQGGQPMFGATGVFWVYGNVRFGSDTTFADLTNLDRLVGGVITQASRASITPPGEGSHSIRAGDNTDYIYGDVYFQDIVRDSGTQDLTPTDSVGATQYYVRITSVTATGTLKDRAILIGDLPLATGSGEANVGVRLGSGEPIYATKSGVNLQFYNVVGDEGVLATLNTTTSDVDIKLNVGGLTATDGAVLASDHALTYTATGGHRRILWADLGFSTSTGGGGTFTTATGGVTATDDTLSLDFAGVPTASATSVADFSADLLVYLTATGDTISIPVQDFGFSTSSGGTFTTATNGITSTDDTLSLDLSQLTSTDSYSVASDTIPFYTATSTHRRMTVESLRDGLFTQPATTTEVAVTGAASDVGTFQRFTSTATKALVINTGVFAAADVLEGANGGAGTLTVTGNATLNGTVTFDENKAYSIKMITATEALVIGGAST